jgi:hypothetical protein
MSNIFTIQAFLNVFSAPIAASNVATAISTVTGLFSPDLPGPPVTPSVGIGANTQDPLGSAFRGNTQITALFTELLSSFPQLTFMPYPTPASPLFCVAQTDPNTIVVPAQLITGPHMARWFPPDAPPKRRFYSKPLSDLVPATAASGNYQTSTVPVCAVFTFDTIAANQFKIFNLALYLDRWKMAQDLWIHGHYPFPHP